MSARRTLTALALAGAAATVGFAAPVQAASHATPLSCSGWINIGDPGNYYSYGQYAGQVEQEYDTCSGAVMAHWQWSANFAYNHPGAEVIVEVESTSGVIQHGYGYGNGNKDVWAYDNNIHDANPDTWYAHAVLFSDCGNIMGAMGTTHRYADGGTDAPAKTGGCDLYGNWY
ncbi:hypothetical protein [Streptacidiphilus sp. EB129]|uniref:hypothetical protein n=1 Tax=Streptacidiphilus sp. EB129 TaxID=3156262 RepID=UPI003514D407